jgi:coenzyme F420-0:L-glutamate ligase/coenzyme F420-1:gamma-L-glutamate ligase
MKNSLTLIPLIGLPEIRPGDNLASHILTTASTLSLRFEDSDVVVIAQKVVSKSEDRRICLSSVAPSALAIELAQTCAKDPRIVELVLRESSKVVRCSKDVLIVRHRLGFTVANAGIDQSNVEDGDTHALLLPEDPDASALRLRDELTALSGSAVSVIINDSFGRPWRRGTCGIALGCAGLEALVKLRGRPDRFGRLLRTSEVAIGDEIAAAASLVMGQADESIPIVVVRGLDRSTRSTSAAVLIRPIEENLFT